jgi:hypothetical protein
MTHTVGRAPPYQRSAGRRDLYMTKHNTQKRHPCPLWNSNPQSQQASGHRDWKWHLCSGGSMLAPGTQVRRVESGRNRRSFQGEKIPSMPSFGGELKLSVPCRTFAAYKRSLHWRGIHHCRQNYWSYLAHSSPFPDRGLSRCCRRGGAWRCKCELPNPG